MAGGVCAVMSNAWLVGFNEYVHPLACETVCVSPAIVTVADRSGPMLAAALNPTLPGPDPLAPEVTVSHDCDGTAVQLQPAGAVTVTDVAAPPAAGTVWAGGAIEIAHEPACVTVCV